jgi:hypothetical protein
MKTLEELLAQWEAGTLSAEDLEELKRLLSQPESRAELVGDWLLHEAVYGALRTDESQQSAPEAAPSPQPVVGRRVQPAPLTSSQPGWLTSLLPRLVWRQVRIQLRWVVVAATAAVLLLVGAYVYFSNRPAMTIAGLQGAVTVQRGAKSLPVRSGQHIYVGDTVRVPAGGAANLVWKGEPTRLQLGEATDLKLLGRARGKEFGLPSGRLQAAVAKQAQGRPLRVRTSQADAIVVGTQFQIEASPAATRLDVSEGAVVLRKERLAFPSDNKEITVQAGQFAVAAPDQLMIPRGLGGYALREVLAFPARSPAFSRSGGTVVWSDSITNLSAAAGLVTLAPSPNLRYESRIRCYLVAPATDDYSFAVLSARPSEVRLSTGEEPAQAQRIFATSLTPPGGRATNLTGLVLFGASPSFGQSHLLAGRRYYLEVRQEYDPSQFILAAWALWGKTGGRVKPPALEPIAGPVLQPYFDEPARPGAGPNP